MSTRSGNRNYRAYVVLSKVGILQDQHAAHGPAHNCSNLSNPKVIQDKFVDTYRVSRIIVYFEDAAYFTSSLIVVNGNSGPYLSFRESPSLRVTGLALPYGLPKLLRHITKNLEVSNARPFPPKSGPHQSPTSALPVRAWHMTMTLSLFCESFPFVM